MLARFRRGGGAFHSRKDAEVHTIAVSGDRVCRLGARKREQMTLKGTIELVGARFHQVGT